MEKITVMHLRNPLGWYGVEEIVAILAEDLKPRGFKTIVVSLESGHGKSSFLQRLGEKGVTGARLSGHKMARLAQLMKLVREHQVDLLHTHTYTSDLLGFLAAKKMGKKVIATAHGWIETDLKLRMMGMGNRFLLKYFDKVIAPSESILARLGHLNPLHLRLIHNCVNPERLTRSEEPSEVERELSRIPSGNILAVIGRLNPEKGHRYLFEAMVEITKMKPDVTLWVVGDGPLKAELIALAGKMGISKNIVFAGYRQEIGTILSLIDLLVVPSLDEGFCLPIIEALAFGNPVVATSVGVATEIAGEYDHVSLVSPKDPGQMASAILNSLSMLGGLKRRLSSNPLLIPEKFSRKKMVDDYEQVYREFVQGRG